MNKIYDHRRHGIELVGFTKAEIKLIEKPKHMQFKSIYISGAITGMPNLNINKFAAAEKHLRHFATVVLNPHSFPVFHDKSWASYMKVCIRKMMNVEVVVVLSCWKRSRGARREVLIAEWLGIPVLSIETMEPVKISWWMKLQILLNLF